MQFYCYLLPAFLHILTNDKCSALLCYKCNERIPNADVCSGRAQEDCTVIFPAQDSICLKTVQTFSSGQPSWVFAQCQIKQAFTVSQLDTCIQPQDNTVGGQNNTPAQDTLTTCTCSTNLCNATRQQSTPFILLTIAAFVISLFIRVH